MVVRQRSHIPPRQRSVSRSRLDGSNAGSSNNGSGRISGRDLDESDGGDDGGSPARSLSGKMVRLLAVVAVCFVYLVVMLVNQDMCFDFIRYLERCFVDVVNQCVVQLHLIQYENS